MIELLIAAAVSLAPAQPAPAARNQPPSREPTLAEVRAASERFRDVKVALAEGYIADPMGVCETAEMMGRPAAQGAMGIHYFRPDLLGISGPPNPRVNGTGTHTDYLKPGVLIYEPQAGGSLQLVAVENLVFAKAWRAAGNSKPPTFHGQAYDHMIDDPSTKLDEAHMFEEHYDRHAWLFRDNPRGVFAQFNPNVSCKHAKAAHAGH
ncbi:hypothetical protein ACFQPG_09040 [Sphingomonas sp. GCM10030256]|uniref:hypothetical protein n=1 Tax=Sphingomonas sp. GCM10030256 TaxID=3273427 RepID=UPI00360C1EB6